MYWGSESGEGPRSHGDSGLWALSAHIPWPQAKERGSASGGATVRQGLRVLSGTTFMISGCLLLGVVMSGCSNRSSSPSTTPTSRATSSTTRTTTQPTTTTTGPSAANDLAAYFAAAMELDQRLKAAAAAANGSIGTDEITISQSTINAIKAAEPSAAAHEIPAGLPPDVLLPALTVQSDLESRYYAFHGFVEAEPGVIPRANPTLGNMSAADHLLNCLGSGSEAANHFRLTWPPPGSQRPKRHRSLLSIPARKPRPISRYGCSSSSGRTQVAAVVAASGQPRSHRSLGTGLRR